MFSNLPVSDIQGQTEIFLSPNLQTFPSGVNSNNQHPTNTDVYDWFPLIRRRSMNTSDELFGGEGNVRAARPTKHTKFKTNKLTTNKPTKHTKFKTNTLTTNSSQLSLSTEMSRLTRYGTAEPVSRDQILRRESGQGNIYFPCSVDHEHDWQPYPFDPYSCYM